MANQKQYEWLYKRAKRPEDLPWHRDEPPEMLRRIVARREPGRALDLGCGTGVSACYLAKEGYAVTALDFTRSAIEISRERAREEGVQLDLVQSDVLEWSAPAPYDLILDSGCLHGLSDGQRVIYRDNLVSWLAPDGDYALFHFERRHLLDWRPVGPRRIPRHRTVGLFAPELIEHAHRAETRSAGWVMGKIRLGSYWFRHGPSRVSTAT